MYVVAVIYQLLFYQSTLYKNFISQKGEINTK